MPATDEPTTARPTIRWRRTNDLRPRGVLGAEDYLDVTSDAFAERLHEAVLEVLWPISRRRESPLLSVSGVVDRRGVEPLTSAVQTHP
jgi:hypothetical protein